MERNKKRILDSVHGYIEIENKYFEKFIDTVYFQRLRRVEQTSVRALFPCSRHDRFVHSLGVFHIGNFILESLEKTDEFKYFPENKMQVFESYKVACLLHDVGHSPFSHTFENFYDNKNNNLSLILDNCINNQDFSSDLENVFKASPHELMSAYIVATVFAKEIEDVKANVELVVRMIIGCKYKNNNRSFENAFIDLIHGEIIDADGIDYVLRDSLSSGYCTADVDLERLISAIVIHYDKKDNIWCVCYSHKAFNEIEAVLSVKTFQQKNIITHHTVVFEQALLVKAMESAAIYHFGIKKNDVNSRNAALERLCNVQSLIGINVILPRHKIPIIYPGDDDFVSLMKYISTDTYVKQWISRKYEFITLWKSVADFFHIFPELHKYNYTSNCWLFSDKCKKFISDTFEIKMDDIWILSGTGNDKNIKISDVKFLINEQIVPYSDIYSNNRIDIQPKPFSYIYIPALYDKRKNDILNSLQEQIKGLIFS